jgi:hypothetical protein
VNADARLRAFLADSLDLWRVSGTVDPGVAPAVAEIRASDGTIVSVERIADKTIPFRWMVRRRGPRASSEERPRPCGSLVGVLGALRTALGVDRGSALRIASSPVDE